MFFLSCTLGRRGVIQQHYFHGQPCIIATLTVQLFFTGLAIPVFSQLTFFGFMYAIIIGTRPDGSRVLLNRPHGTALRVGTPVFRAIFLSFGASRRIRTIIYTFVEPSEWYQLQIAHSRIFLFFDFQPPTVVLSPRVERVPLPASAEAQSSVSEDGSDV